ncbi:MAG: hypothetical protein IPI30_06925 [Saprospiraceae bacterium]|nr:hypothetical protein [Candidatus Vicinibacter affinis]
MSWSADKTVSVERGLLLFCLKVKLSEYGIECITLKLSQSGLHAELYIANGETDLKLLFRSEEQKPLEGSYELYQNIWNPFTGNTTVFFIDCLLTKMLKLSVFDISGKLLQTYNLTGRKGLALLKFI